MLAVLPSVAVLVTSEGRGCWVPDMLVHPASKQNVRVEKTRSFIVV
jgi:hypothetical protein